MPLKKKRKSRPYETTCDCGAYKFPHRFGGGRCNGMWVVDNTWHTNYGGGVCATCNNLNTTEQVPFCEVLEGTEDAGQCPEWQDYVAYNEIRIYR